MVRFCFFLLLTAFVKVNAQTAVYRLHLNTSVTTQFNMIGADIPDTSLNGTLEGILRMKVIQKERSNVHYSCSFDTLSTLRFPLTDNQLETMTNDLKKGFGFRQLKDGNIDSVYLHPDISDATESVILQFLECYQANLTEKRQPTWNSTITLSDGTVNAQWTSSSEPNKTKNIRLVHLEEQKKPGMERVEMLYRYTNYDTDLCWTFGRDQTLHQLEGHLNRRAKVNHKTMTRLDNTISMTRIPAAQQTGINKPDVQSYSYVRTLSYTQKTAERERIESIERSKRFSIPMLLKGIALNQIKKDENLRDLIVENIRLAFQTDKDSLWLLKDAFMNTQPDSLDYRTIRAGIASSSTPYAQAIVAEYLTRYAQDELRLKRIIPSAGLMKNGGPQLQLALENIAYGSSQNASAAKLALGNMVGSIKQTNPQRADSMTHKLAQSLIKGNDDFLMLSVLGNCGVPTILSYVKPFLSDSIPAMRGYACYALRFLNQLTIDEIYLQALKTEMLDDARQHIFNGLFFRKPNQAIIDYVYQLILTEKNENNGLTAVRLLFQWSYNQPDLLNLIYKSSLNGASQEVRKMAAELYANTDEGGVAKN